MEAIVVMKHNIYYSNCEKFILLETVFRGLHEFSVIVRINNTHTPNIGGFYEIVKDNNYI